MSSTLLLAKKLIATKNPQTALEICQSNLKGYKVEKFFKNGCTSILVYKKTFSRPRKFKIILNGHLDVIPGKVFQYRPRIVDGRLYGVGTTDMKSSLACLINVFKKVVKKINYPLALQLVTDEEVGGFYGTKFQLEKGVRSEFTIAGETTNFNIATQAKGILWLKISAKGKSAHGAYPWKGTNAAWLMNQFLSKLLKLFPNQKETEWKNTLNLSNIQTNNRSFNKIPDWCEIWLDIRYLPNQANKIISKIKKILPQSFKLHIELKEPSMKVNINNHYLKKLKTISEKVLNKPIKFYGAHGSSDARHFTNINCPAVEFGPIGGGSGSDQEWVDINSLKAYSSTLEKFLLSL